MKGQVHLSGIGGVGMSALAQALLDQGMTVSGSDRLLDSGDTTEVLGRLRRQGVQLFPQDGSGVTGQTPRLVVSTAIEADNPDIVQARACGVAVVHRAAELAQLISGRRLIAVTGTCGKSTVTAMLGCLLEAMGWDPLVVNGAAVVGWDLAGRRIGAVRKGEGAWAVVEADESDRSLMQFHPEHAIITNVSADHFTLDESEALFAAFRARVPGMVIDGRREGLAPEALRLDGWSGFFRFEGTDFEVPMPGAHNVYNAWHAVRLACALGGDPAVLARALRSFRGVERRLQRVGLCAGSTVVDDYAHNPEKLAAAWTTLAGCFSGGVCAVWRPHGYAPLRKMLEGLVQAFARVCRPQDTLLLLPVYDAGGTADRGITSTVLASQLREKGVTVSVTETLESAEEQLRRMAGPGKVLATFGARDPGLPRLAERLARPAQSV